ncbi:MAG: peptidoglycan DD-metalloendopeptidase family protein [Oscillospiraceae bacterium]|nr:peptidoglycan DD-metalloendopeptidase family protein [Oscillospiraceae bacterium]
MVIIFKKTINFLCILLFLTNCFSENLECSAELSKLKQKAENMKKKIEENKKNIRNQIKNQENINEKISKLKSEIDALNIKIFKLNKQVLKEKQDIINYQKEISKNIADLGKFLASIHKANNPGILEIILASKSFGDFFDKIKLAKFFGNKVTTIIEEVDQKIFELIQKKQQNEKNLKEIKNCKIVLTKSRQNLEELFQKSKTSRQHSEIAIEKDENELQRVFDKIETERKKDEILKKQRNNIFLTPEGPDDFKISRPFKGSWIITSDFNDTKQRKKAHGAIDFSGPNFYGTEILAAEDGEVAFIYIDAGNNGRGYGTYIIIKHKNSYTTLYAHMSLATVKKGQQIKKGEVIGYGGNTGYSTGAHLHFELRKNGKPVNPSSYF